MTFISFFNTKIASTAGVVQLCAFREFSEVLC